MEDHLTWMAMNVHEWPYPLRDTCFIGRGYHDQVFVHSDSIIGISTVGRHQISKQKWLARRSELQNKPSWKDAPQDASYLAQEPHGMWTFFFDRPYEPSKLSDDGWRFDGFQAWCSECRGEVLGDWRDTLERRPVDLSEPAGGVKERGADGAEEINAMAQRLLAALKSEPRSFDTGALAEMVELADAEIVKRDAKVCGGEGYLNNHWFERGELPPVGVECEFHGGARVGREWPDSLKDGAKVKVLCHYTPCMRPVAVFSFDIPGGKLTSQASEACFRPIRTERDLAVEEMKRHCPHHGSWDAVGRIYAEALYDAGYRKQVSPAK